MLDGESAHDVHLHYFLRPDHWDVADLWAPHWSADLPPLAFHDRHDWLFDHIENLHEAGSRTICAVNGRTGGVAGFVTFDPRAGRLNQIVVAASARGTGAAALLLNEAKRFSPSGLAVDVDGSNTRALGFFAREGFLQTVRDSENVKMQWQAA